MVSILHLSDLHIVQSSQWHNIRACILKDARRVHDDPKGEKLLIVTGDFHNFWEADYDEAREFLNELIDVMDLEREKDVFLIPGNHDVGSKEAMEKHFASDSKWKMRETASVKYLKTSNSAEDDYRDFIDWRMESYVPYCKFVQELDIYPDGSTRPAEVHVRNWRGRLNLLHLNTTLIADGKTKDKQRVDTLTATDDSIWDKGYSSLPALALGHNSFFDLDEEHQKALYPVFRRHHVRAYLCGDTHKAENDRYRRMIRLKNDYSPRSPQIPNVVCVKGAADDAYDYSDFGLYWHKWDTEKRQTTLFIRSWEPDQDQSEFQPPCEAGTYSMRPGDEPDEAFAQIAAIREKLQKKDGPEPQPTSRYQQAEEKLDAGNYDEALSILRQTDREQELAEDQRARIRQYISENMLEIEILKAKGVNQKTIPDILTLYEKSVALAKEYRVSLYVLYDYAVFSINTISMTPLLRPQNGC